MPGSIRPAFAALWNLDLAFADVVSTSSDPRLGAIRLAWWRERLEQLDEGVAGPAEPRLQAVARELLPRGVTGLELSQLEDAWLPLLSAFPWSEEQAVGVRLRGELLFGLGARLLGAEARESTRVGVLWSLMDAAEHCSDPPSREFLAGRAREAAMNLPKRVSRKLRPMTVLGALAASDVAGASMARRTGAAVVHRLTGGFPRLDEATA